LLAVVIKLNKTPVSRTQRASSNAPERFLILVHNGLIFQLEDSLLYTAHINPESPVDVCGVAAPQWNSSTDPHTWMWKCAAMCEISVLQHRVLCFGCCCAAVNKADFWTILTSELQQINVAV